MYHSRKTLLKLAREGQLTHPAKLESFNLQAWIQAYEYVKDGSEMERGFLNGVAWLNENFQRVRSTRNQFTFERSEPLTANELIQAHLAAANYFFYLVSAEQMEAITQTPEASMEQHMSLKSSMTHGGIKFSPNGLNMHRLDSLCYSLRELLKGRSDIDQLFPAARPHQLKKMIFLENETKMAQYSYNLSRIWQDLLYGETSFFPHEAGMVLISTTRSPHLIKTISEYRREHHNGFNGLEIIRDIRNHYSICETLLARSQYLKYDHNTQPVLTTSWHSLEDEIKGAARHQYFAPLYMIDKHLRPILNSSLPNSKDLIIRNILNVWFHLSVLASQIKTVGISNPTPDSWSSLKALAPKFKLDILISRLSSCTNLDKNSVASIVKMLTYEKTGTSQDDLWSQPLILLGEYCSFPVSALLTASIGRNIDTWLKKVDPKSKRRGKLFEQDLLDTLKECADTNPILGKHLNWTPAIRSKYEPKKVEEIDLTFSFGKIIVIAELRSRRTPITPLDYHNELSDKNGLNLKTEQAIRKAQRVRDNIKPFCDAHYPALSNRTDLLVIPLVIVNGQFHAGYPYNNVAVLDPHLLTHFLKDAEARFYGSIEEENSHMYSLPIYDCIDTAEQAFPEYIKNPTLIQLYNILAKETTTKYDVFGDGFPPVFSVTYDLSDVSPEVYLKSLERISNGRLRKNF
ncbi:hypothetical protein [Pseudomonas chlororaphis]|uniref:hypothetical protein n=1 Tax=Pseudomonas chlororaphis TaxID=587753 RepID=UPI000B2B72E1|nr:hypothetical protein [Pseudomonas chlororaphis]